MEIRAGWLAFELGRGVELWGVLAYSSNAQSEPEQELEGVRRHVESSPEPSAVTDPRHYRRAHHRGAHRYAYVQSARSRTLATYRGRCVLDRPALLLQCRADAGHGGSRGGQ